MHRWLLPCLFILTPSVAGAGFWIADSIRSQNGEWRKELVVRNLLAYSEEIPEIQLEEIDINTYVGTSRLENGQVYDIKATFEGHSLEVEDKSAFATGHSSYSFDFTVTHPRFLQFIRLCAICFFSWSVVFPLLRIFRLRPVFRWWIELALFTSGLLGVAFLVLQVHEFVTHI